MKNETLEKYLLSQTALPYCVPFEEFVQFFDAEREKDIKTTSKISEHKASSNKSKQPNQQELDEKNDKEAEVRATLRRIYSDLVREDNHRRQAIYEAIQEYTLSYENDTSDLEEIPDVMADALINVLDEETEEMEEECSSLKENFEGSLDNLEDVTTALLLKVKKGEEREGTSMDFLHRNGEDPLVLTTTGTKRTIEDATENVRELRNDLTSINKELKKLKKG